MPIKTGAILLASIAAVSGTVLHAEQPLSAIDWLSRSVATPGGTVVGPTSPVNSKAEAPVDSDGALPEDVSTSTLDGPSPDGAGLLSSRLTGLPRDLWGMGLEADIIAAISAEQPEPLPALQGLLMTVLLAESAPPVDSKGKGSLLLARTDKLLDMGALEQADALLEASGATDAAVFQRSFDIALLTGNEDQGCDMMRALPNLAPTFPARIFCLARSGDWNAAALTLRTAQALGQITEDEDSLLSRFLDVELDDGETVPPVPKRISPLTWRLFEAIGEPLSTATLPLAFAHAELRETAGWKAQVEAAERLARVGSLSPNALLGLYTQRLAAASGGVWDRVDAVQEFDAALRSRNLGAISRTLPVAWQQVVSAELEVPFAILYADQLAGLDISDEARRIAFEVGLLSPGYRQAATAFSAVTPRESFLIAIATEKFTEAVPQDSIGRAILPAFLQPEIAPDEQRMIDERRVGEALLTAIRFIGSGLQGQMTDVTKGLSLLRKLGLEDVARRTALQLLLLERRG